MAKPVSGSATAATSAADRFAPQPVAAKPAESCCHRGAENRTLQPPPVAPSTNAGLLDGVPSSFQTVSEDRFSATVSFRLVPPTAMTPGIEEGAFGRAGAGGANPS